MAVGWAIGSGWAAGGGWAGGRRAVTRATASDGDPGQGGLRRRPLFSRIRSFAGPLFLNNDLFTILCSMTIFFELFIELEHFQIAHGHDSTDRTFVGPLFHGSALSRDRSFAVPLLQEHIHELERRPVHDLELADHLLMKR